MRSSGPFAACETTRPSWNTPPGRGSPSRPQQEREDLEAELLAGLDEGPSKQGEQQGACSFVLLLSLSCGGGKNLSRVFAFISIAFQWFFFFPLLYKDGLYLSEEKQEEKVL